MYIAINQRLKIEMAKEVKNFENIAYLESVLAEKGAAIQLVMNNILADEVA